MKNCELTADSSAAFSAELQALSPDAQAWLYKLDDDYQQLRQNIERNKIGRAAHTIERNKARSEDVRAPIRQALENVCLHDKKTSDLVCIVISYMELNSLKVPSVETIEREVRKQRNEIGKQ